MALMALPPDKFASLVKERIDQKKYDELFSAGCCFDFALRAYKRGIGSLTCIPAACGGDIAHVFVLNDKGQAFDHKGYRDLFLLKKDFHPLADVPAVKHTPITESDVQKYISKRALPKALEQIVIAIADEIITEKTGLAGSVERIVR